MGMDSSKKELIVGLDLSFSSTGISIIKCIDDEAKSIEFHRIVYNTVPHPIDNINQHTYNLPVNINPKDLTGGEIDDFYSDDQALITLKGIVITQRIIKIIDNKIKSLGCEIDSLIINIEGFIMPDIAGGHQLRVIGGLIMFQGLVRSDIIKYIVRKRQEYGNSFQTFKLYITSPSALKSYFTGNGNADKELMLEAFLTVYDGSKLLPDTSSIKKVNDVVDSFALAINAFDRYYYSWKPKPKVKKNKKPKTIKLKDGTVINKKEYLTMKDKEESVDLLMSSIPTN